LELQNAINDLFIEKSFRVATNGVGTGRLFLALRILEHYTGIAGHE